MTETITQPKRTSSKAIKVLALGSVLVIAIVVAHFAWKYSGSNTWELKADKNGVKVYALKSPGSTLYKFKAVTRVKTTLSRITAAVKDTSSEACAVWVPGCVAGDILEPWTSQSLSFTQYYSVKFPLFRRKDLVIKTQFVPDPQGKGMLVQCTALPDRLPRNPCCSRVTDLRNSWRYTDVGNGEVEVEFYGDYDAGIPYFMFNFGVPKSLTKLLSRLGDHFNKEKYQHEEAAFLREPLATNSGFVQSNVKPR